VEWIAIVLRPYALTTALVMVHANVEFAHVILVTHSITVHVRSSYVPTIAQVMVSVDVVVPAYASRTMKGRYASVMCRNLALVTVLIA
jgi:hypothetical protein